jgi:tRNA (guanine37-N1)-methyltransferase
MKVSILTVFPNLYIEFLQTSLIKRAREQAKVTFDVQAFSSFCQPKEHIDGPIVGHGAGMVIRPEVVERAIAQQESLYGKSYNIFLTPQGKNFDQRMALQLADVLQQKKHIAFFAGRYEGIDQRAHDVYADLEISIGDFVLMGGDLPVMVILEAIARYVPGVVGREESVVQDSFSGPFVDFPTYTAPRQWQGKDIPEVLLSGNHAAMEKWRQAYAIEKSVTDHFDWVRSHCITKEQTKQVTQALVPHYCALMHSDVIVQQTLVGTSSVTSIDIHDIARSSRTYGIKNYFVVTPLIDQQKIVAKVLQFWDEAGIGYNRNRADAVSKVELKDSLESVIAAIEAQEGKKPVIVGTSAKKVDGCIPISYNDQSIVWQQKRPVLFVFGTAQGLSSELIKKCDYLLGPVEGFSDFNHLSVRSAAAIIFDRWLGKYSFTCD